MRNTGSMLPTVAVGETWTDPRNPTRRIEVLEVSSRFARCVSWWEGRGGKRRTRIELSTFRRLERLAAEDGVE